MTLIIILCHLLIDGLCGLSVLLQIGEKHFNVFTIIKAIAIGMFIDTMVLGILHYMGISILTGFIIFAIGSILFYLYNVKISKKSFTWNETIFKKRLSFWEVIILIFLGEKIVWNIVNLIHLPVYFDDTLNHWSGRGKALLNGVNWSWDPDSIYFLGKTFGHMEYPLFASIWRATNTAFLGGATGASERADSLIMAIIVMSTAMIWIYQRTDSRLLGLIGATIIGSIPIQVWHMSAGYMEIFIQAYLILAIWSLMNDRYILAGIFSAAMIWSKNEGLILFVPCLLLCLVFKLLVDRQNSIKSRLISFARYNIAWLLAISPWFLFKLMNGVGFTIPGNNKIAYVEGSFGKMIEALMLSPSSSILWIFILVALFIGSHKIIKDKELFILATGALFLLGMMTFVFTCTSAYIFLANEMTIHRSLLQIAPIFIIVVVIALGKDVNPPLLEAD